MSSGILVLNAGSSSIKFSLYIDGEGAPPVLSCKGQIDGINVDPHFVARCVGREGEIDRRWGKSVPFTELLSDMLDWIEGHLGYATLGIAGHRVVHGGRNYAAPLLIDDDVMTELHRLIPLAPLHEPFALEVISATRRLYPDLPQVACFDTAFHRNNDRLATLFALPRELIDAGVIRYGFHGLSYEFIAHRLRELSPETAKGKVIVCHLGSGASMCAIDNGRSVCSTMGFTALDGLPMGTRTGSLDCGVLLYLMQEKGMDVNEVQRLLYHKSGLLGLSGISNDMRLLVGNDHPHAKEAVDYFVYRVGRELGSLAAAMGGVDAVVFTAGIGEHSPEIRSRVLKENSWLGLAVDEDANKKVKEGLISPAGTRCPAWVIPTDEELMIARRTAEFLVQSKKGFSETR